MNGCVAPITGLLSLPLSSKGGEGNSAANSEQRKRACSGPVALGGGARAPALSLSQFGP
jgi:hypothetical protein